MVLRKRKLIKTAHYSQRTTVRKNVTLHVSAEIQSK